MRTSFRNRSSLYWVLIALRSILGDRTLESVQHGWSS